MEWISVKDRKPEVDWSRLGQQYDIMILLPDRTVMMGQFREGKFFAFWNEGLGEVDKSRPVTHWMPLPEPPKN